MTVPNQVAHKDIQKRMELYGLWFVQSARVTILSYLWVSISKTKTYRNHYNTILKINTIIDTWLS